MGHHIKAANKSRINAFDVKCVKARKDYTCQTCNGEFPIVKGMPYVSLAISGLTSKPEHRKICLRCWYAACRKMLYGKQSIDLSPGALRWAALSKTFRNEWQLYIETVHAEKETTNQAIKAELQKRIAEMEADFQRQK